eukprot:CAMPEP_0183729238 /NCGR_PEP_ID=MMETSP0737-20130205/29979_1 /TAXON_ID=385413 /ORGANISM="Thalassiosira miniscula, Strain CCMP1093" /LENGTH=82 /DNA_ID=CAMNT_0025961385 /DNA_START=34 /DNA_END=278 /DNA_ORIENTATION=-
MTAWSISIKTVGSHSHTIKSSANSKPNVVGGSSSINSETNANAGTTHNDTSSSSSSSSSSATTTGLIHSSGGESNFTIEVDP